MKKFALILLTLLCFSANGQNATNKMLEEAFKEVAFQADLRGIDLFPILERRLVSLEVKDSLTMVVKGDTIRPLGRAIPLGGGKFAIKLSAEAFSNFTTLSHVLAHEIGHGVGIKHCCTNGAWCPEIMSSGFPTNSEHLVFQLFVIREKKIWDKFFTHENFQILQKITEQNKRT